MQRAVFSLDVCLEIIDSLAADTPNLLPFDIVGPVPRPNVQRSALCALALTCSAWLPRARAHLYHSVTLYDARAIEQFFRTLTANPRLGALVRSLQLCVRWVGAFGPPSVMLGAHALTRLEELEVAMADAEQGEGPFQFVGALAVARPLPKLTLHRAFFATLEEFATLTASFESVRTLTLAKCSSEEDTFQPDAIDPGLCRNVVHLQITNFMNNADQFLQVIPRTLHSLAIGERIGTEDVFESDKYEALAEFTALAHLSLETRYGADEPEWMEELLSRIRCTTVRSVELKYWMIAATSIDQMLGEAQLGAIDAVLSGASFENLGYLNIFFSFNAHGYEEEKVILDALSEHVAKSTAGCSARGVHVSIELGTEFPYQPWMDEPSDESSEED